MSLKILRSDIHRTYSAIFCLIAYQLPIKARQNDRSKNVHRMFRSESSLRTYKTTSAHTSPLDCLLSPRRWFGLEGPQWRPQEMETGEAVRIGVHSAQAAVPPEHPRRKGRAGVCPQRGADRLLTSGCGCCGSSPDSDRGDSCRAGATASLPDCLLHSSSMPLSRTKRAAGGRRSLTLTPPSPKASPFSVERLPARVPAAAATQIERTPPTSGSVWRLHAAQAQWASARGTRALLSSRAGGRKGGRSARKRNEIWRRCAEAARLPFEVTHERGL